MSAVFLELFNRAVSAGWLLLALLILQPVLKKLPAWARCLLWGLAAVRLVLPIRFRVRGASCRARRRSRKIRFDMTPCRS